MCLLASLSWHDLTRNPPVLSARLRPCRRRILLPEVVLPEVVMPEAVMPEVVMPEVLMPEVVKPDFVMPEVVMLGVWWAPWPANAPSVTRRVPLLC